MHTMKKIQKEISGIGKYIEKYTENRILG